MAIVDYNNGLARLNDAVQSGTAAERIEQTLERIADACRPRAEFVVSASNTPRNRLAADYLCDGTADQVTIQSAIDAANAAGGGRVILRDGTFVTSDSIVIKSGVSIIGEDIQNTIITAVGTPTAENAWSAFDHIRGGAGTPSEGSPIADVRLEGFTIDCSGLRTSDSYSTNCKGIFAEFCRRWLISHLRLVETAATAIGIDFLVDVVIRDCVIDGFGQQLTNSLTQYGGNGIGIGTGKYTFENWIAVNNCINEVGGVGNNGFVIERQADATPDDALGWVIANNTVRGGYCGARVASAKGGLISGNYFYTPREAGVATTGYPPFVTGVAQDEPNEDIVIQGNLIQDSADAGVFINFGDDPNNSNNSTIGVVVRGNTIKGTGTNGPGIRVNRGRTVADVTQDIIIDGNRITDHGNIGIVVAGNATGGQVTNVSITNNEIARVASDGIAIDGAANVSIRGNRIDTPDNNGIRISSTTDDTDNIDISGNVIVNPGDAEAGEVNECGIRIGDTSGSNATTRVRLSDNYAIDTRGTAKMEHGLYVTTRTASVSVDGMVSFGEKQSDPWDGIEDATDLVYVRGSWPLNNGSRGAQTITVGTSPWTRTAGPVEEILYLNGGTITGVTKGGVSLGAVRTIRLAPLQSCIVTYSVAPTAVVDRV